MLDEAKALGLFEEAAGLGNMLSMLRLGVACEFGELGVEVDEGKALQFYCDAAWHDCIAAQGIMAGIYEDGHFCGLKCVFKDVDPKPGSCGGITLVVLV